MAVQSITYYLGQDLTNVYANTFSSTVVYNSVTYTVLIDDLIGQELESFGGEEIINFQNIHFKTSSLASVVIGGLITVAGVQKIILSFVKSSDGIELIVKVRNP